MQGCVYVCVYVCAYVYGMYVYVCMCVRMYVCVYVCAYVYVYVYVCMYVCMCMSVYIHTTHIHTSVSLCFSSPYSKKMTFPSYNSPTRNETYCAGKDPPDTKYGSKDREIKLYVRVYVCVCV